MDNSDLIGKTFRNADGRLFEVEAIDNDHPSVVECLDHLTGQRGCARGLRAAQSRANGIDNK